MTRIQTTRLVSGPNAGKLRIVLTLDLCADDELKLAASKGKEDIVRALLDLPKRQRGIGPAGDIAVDALFWGLYKQFKRKPPTQQKPPAHKKRARKKAAKRSAGKRGGARCIS